MKAIEVSDANFKTEVLESPTPVLVDFWAVWCGPCKMIAPIVEEIANEFDGKLKVGKIDVDANQQVAMQFGIRSIPTLLLFKNGKVVDQIVGAVPKKALAEKITKHLN
ncbi:MAG: thioredoxin [bacterium]